MHRQAGSIATGPPDRGLNPKQLVAGRTCQYAHPIIADCQDRGDPQSFRGKCAERARCRPLVKGFQTRYVTYSI